MTVHDGARQRREPLLDVVDDDAGQVLDLAGGEGRHRAGVAGAPDELVAVHGLADAGDVQPARAGLP